MTLPLQFWLYTGTFQDPPDDDEFVFVLNESVDIPSGAFILWDHQPAFAYIARFQQRRKIPKSDYWKYTVSNKKRVRISIDGLLNTLGISKDERWYNFVPFPLPTEESDRVKAILLKSNESLPEEYFSTTTPSLKTDPFIQASDAVTSGLRIFGWNAADIPPGIEDQIILRDAIDLSHSSILGDYIETTGDGRVMFTQGERRLYVQVVNRHALEKCLGVDMIYNFIDEQRLVFIQYKCPRKDRRSYSSAGDRSGQQEVERMKAIPGVSLCLNRTPEYYDHPRLCACPFYMKLLDRQTRKGQTTPPGVYFPLCVWESILAANNGMISTSDEPHFQSNHFHVLLRKSFIGTTPDQSSAIDRWVRQETGDDRLRLIFEEHG